MAVAFVVRGGSVSGPAPPRIDLAVTIDDMDGKKVDLSPYAGKPLVINLWATWCVPCRIETPQLVALSEKFKAQGISFIGISTDDKPDAIRAFAAEFKVPYPMLVGLTNERFVDHLGYTGVLPFTILLDKTGIVAGQITGIETTESWEKRLAELIK